MTSRSNFTLSYAGFYGQTFEEFLEQVSTLGFGAAQFIPDQTPNLIRQLTEIRRLGLARTLEERGLRSSVHAVFYDINLVSVVPEVQDCALKVIEQCLELNMNLGGVAVTVHPGYMFPGWRSNSWQEAVFWEAAHRGIQQLDRLAQRYGAVVCLENGSYYVSDLQSETKKPLHVGISVSELVRLLEPASERIGVCLDIGKAVRSRESPETFAAAFGSRIRQVQVSGPTSWKAFTELGGLDEAEVVFEGGPEALKSLKFD